MGQGWDRFVAEVRQIGRSKAKRLRRATQVATLPTMSDHLPAITPPDVPPEVQRDERGRWKPGASPNPSGRSRSDLEVAALLARLTPRALEVLGQKMEEGDLAAAKAITSLGIAPPKSRPVRVDIGPLRTAHECVAAIGRISEAVSSAEITPTDATPLIGLVEAAQKSLELADMDARLRALEARSEGS